MARDEITPDTSAAGGTPVASADTGQADGHKFRNTGRTLVRVENTNGGATRDVTFQTDRTVDGVALGDLTVTLAASQVRIFGPFPVGTYNQNADPPFVYVDYDSGNESDLAIEIIEPG